MRAVIPEVQEGPRGSTKRSTLVCWSARLLKWGWLRVPFLHMNGILTPLLFSPLLLPKAGVRVSDRGRQGRQQSRADHPNLSRSLISPAVPHAGRVRRSIDCQLSGCDGACERIR